MNPRERYLAALLFNKPDRVPLSPGNGRASTRAAWHAQGLPPHIDIGSRIAEYAYRQAGGRLEWPAGGESFHVNERMIPQFEEKVIERRERTQIVQDWNGNICEIGSEYTLEHLRKAIDFVTRRWIKCPVENRSDWEEMKKRYDPEDPARLPKDAATRAKALAHRDWPVTIEFSGPFWEMREWLGLENLCMLFHDDPDLAREMIAFWEAFVARLLERTFAHFVPDEVYISEDIAYKKFPLISPDMVREFLLPTYRRWGNLIRGAGVSIYSMDSDGFVDDLIPIWIEAGINVCDPMEVAAGNDLPAMQRKHGKRMAFRGGFDKRAMAQGPAAIDREMARLEPAIRAGGYIPGCDHGVPADVSWENFVYYVGRLAKATGWMP
jgi:hypothetical protein